MKERFPLISRCSRLVNYYNLPSRTWICFLGRIFTDCTSIGSLGAFSKHHGLLQIQNNAGSIHSHLPPTKLLPLSLLLQLGDVSSWCCCGRQRAICVSDFPKVSKSKHHLRAAVWSCMRGKRTPLRGIKFILIFSPTWKWHQPWMSRMSHVTTTLNNTNSWPLTIGLPKRKVVSRISKPPFFSGYVSFTEGRWWFEPRFLGSNKQIQGKLWPYDQGLVKTHWFSLGF